MQLDNSKRAAFVACPRKYFYRYVKHLTSQTGSTALRYGTTWHGFLEGFYLDVLANGWGERNIEAGYKRGQEVWERESEKFEFYEDYRTFENCASSFLLYLSEFAQDRQYMKILQPERTFKVEMVLSKEENHLFPNFNLESLYFTGQIDLEVELSGQDWIIEFKSTGQPISIQAERLQRSAQILGYTWAAKQTGGNPTGVLVSLHQLLSRRVKAGGYGKLTQAFLRQPNIFCEADFTSWRQSFLYTANQIAEATARQFFPCQFDSCYQFGKCQFARLCEQNRPFEELNIDGFLEEEWDVLKREEAKPPKVPR